MKKIIFFIALANTLVFLPSITLTSAQDTPGYAVPPEYRPTYAPGTYIEDNPQEAVQLPPYSVQDFWFFIGDIAKILLSITGVTTVYFIVTAGFSYVTAGGRQEKLDEAKNTLKWALLGFFAVIFSYILIDLLIGFVTSISGT